LEVIDINNTGSTVTLNNDDILSIVGDEAANDLRVNGTVGDTLNLNSNGFVATGSTEDINAVTYDIYSNAALDSSVRLLVQQGVGVTDFDPSIVVFDLVNGVSSDHSSRTFDVNESYTIYVVVDATSHVLNTTPTTAATWGAWSSGGSVGTDDQLVLVSGDGGLVEGVNGQHVFTDLNHVTAGYFVWGSAGFAVLLNETGDVTRYHSNQAALIDLWTGTAVGFAGGGYGQPIPAGILTSQGLV
jgi:hypothetical protein